MIDILRREANSLKKFLELDYISIKTKNGSITIGEKLNNFFTYKIQIDENTFFEASRVEDFNEKELFVLKFFVKLILDSYSENEDLNISYLNTSTLNSFDKVIFQSNIQLKEELIKMLLETIKVKDEELFEHSKGVSFYSKLIASKFFNEEDKIKDIEIAALLHDIGKISIKEEILFKPSKLREDEFEIIKKHPEVGYKIISRSELLKDIANYVLLHHEWANGMGYPFGLKGDKIPIEAQIVSIADYIEANLNRRNYATNKTISSLIKELESLKNIKFKEEIVNKAIEVLKTIEDENEGFVY
jgi:putative nucleotidyltransferase with HDIG domain